MRKFVIQSVKGLTSIVEVEYEVMPKHYDYALQEGQWKGKITAPTSLYEKDKDGNFVPPIWCWWAFHDSIEVCIEYLKDSFKESIVRTREKKSRIVGIACEPLTIEELNDQVTEELSKVKVVRLRYLNAI